MEIIARVFFYFKKKIDLRNADAILLSQPPVLPYVEPTLLLLFLYLSLVSLLVLCTMTRFGFLSLALFSLQAFVGTGFAAVCLSCPSRPSRTPTVADSID
jgi:hypothetical protein